MRICLLFFVAIPLAHAAPDGGPVGKAETGILVDLLSGNLGLFIGLAIAIFGFYQALVEQKTWGWVMIIGGTIVTAWPGIFKGMYEGVNPLASSVTGGGYERPPMKTF